jgi:hypothetical protein
VAFGFAHERVSLMAASTRRQRLKVTLTPLERSKLEDWRFIQRMPSRAAAVRALLKLGLASEGIDITPSTSRSQDFSEGASEE